MSSVYSLQKIPVSRLWRCRTICDHHTRFLCSLNNRSSTSWWFAWVCACGLALTLASKQSPGKHAARGVLWRMYKQGSERAEHGEETEQKLMGSLPDVWITPQRKLLWNHVHRTLKKEIPNHKQQKKKKINSMGLQGGPAGSPGSGPADRCWMTFNLYSMRFFIVLKSTQHVTKVYCTLVKSVGCCPLIILWSGVYHRFT